MKSHWFLAYVLAATLGATTVVHARVGLQPQTSVTPGGGVSISLDIPLPPGTAGLTPKIGFSYSANGAIGVMTKGWGLSGISSVTRCAPSLAADLLDRGIQYDPLDAFCLDGKRLIQTSSGQSANGYNYVEFRSDVESFQRIVGRFPAPNSSSGGISNAGIAGHPYGFRVWSTSGTTTDFGLFESAAGFDVQGSVGYSPSDGPSVSPQYSVPLIWSIRRQMDSFGNRIDYAYLQTINSWYQNGGAGTLRISKIEYGANSKVTPALPHHSRVDFEYMPRSGNPIFADSIAVGFFKFGGRTLNTEYLSKVSVTTLTQTSASVSAASTQLVGVYKPVYRMNSMSISPLIWQAVVSAIQTCNPANDQLCSEIQPAAFTYDSDSFTFGERTPLSAAVAGPPIPLSFNINASMNGNPAFWVDLNGDGLVDICVPKTVANVLGINCRLATKQPQSSAGSLPSLDPEYAVQFSAPASGPTFFGPARTLPPSPYGTGGFSRKPYMADVNGDGKTDICFHDVRSPEFGGWNPGSPGLQEVKCYLSQSTADTVSFGGANQIVPASDFVTAPFGSYDGSNLTIALTVYLQDLNKDGLADLCYSTIQPGTSAAEFVPATQASATYHCSIRNPRSGEIQAVSFSAGSLNINSQSFVDLNRDGLVDVCYGINDQTLCMTLNDSGASSNAYSYSVAQNRAFGPNSWPVSRIWDPSESIQAGGNWVDINGDGYMDVCLVTDSYKLACVAGNGNGWGTNSASNMDGLAYWFGTSPSDQMDVGFEETRQWTDLDGDGRMDFCRVSNATGQLILGCHLNKPDPNNPVGVRFTAVVNIAVLNPNTTTTQPLQGYQGTGTWIDANGDGQTDYCRQRVDDTTVDCFLVRSTFGELRTIESVGNRTTLKYGYLPTTVSYTPLIGPPSNVMPSGMTGVAPTVLPSATVLQTGPNESPQLTYPWVAYTPPMRIVTSITKSLIDGDNVAGLTTQTSYQVTGRITNLLDARSGGFVSTKVISQINGGFMSTVQKSALMFPFAGYPLRTESFGPDGSLLKRTESWYEAVTSLCGPGGFGASNPPFTGAKSWPYVVRSPRTEEKVWDAGNKFVSGKQTTIASIDNCGNATQVVVSSFGDAFTLSGYKSTTLSQYQPPNLSLGLTDTAKWNVGKVTQMAVTHVKPATTATATLSFPTPGVSLNQPAPPPPPPVGSLTWLPAVLSVILN